LFLCSYYLNLRFLKTSEPRGGLVKQSSDNIIVIDEYACHYRLKSLNKILMLL
jgi:hypothetical protein